RQAILPSGMAKSTPSTSASPLWRRWIRPNSRMRLKLSAIHCTLVIALSERRRGKFLRTRPAEHALRPACHVDHDHALRGVLYCELARAAVSTRESGYKVVGWLLDNFSRGALLHDSGTGSQNDDAVAEQERLVDVVCDEDDRLA